MRKWICLFITCLLTASAAADDGDMKQFEGVWKVVDGQADGMQIPEKIRESMRMTIKGDKLKLSGNDGSDRETTFSIDPAKKTLDIQPPKGETKVALGIYKFEGGKLTLCLADGERPKGFSSTGGCILLVFEKQ